MPAVAGPSKSYPQPEQLPLRLAFRRGLAARIGVVDCIADRGSDRSAAQES